MKAIILSAGIGSRLGDTGKKIPKCLLKLGDKTLLERQIEILNSCGIRLEDVIVIIGEEGEAWNKENQERVKKIHSNIIINNQNVKKNQTYSLWLAIKDLEENTLCIDGDTIFKKEIIEKMLDSKYPSVLLTRNGEKTEKRLRVSIQNDRILEIGKEVESERIYTPLLKFSPDFLKILKQEIKKGIYFDFNINVPINSICRSCPIYNLSITHEAWPGGLPTLNINTPEEYSKVKNLFAENELSKHI